MGKTPKYQPSPQDSPLVSLLHLHSFRHILHSLLRPVSKQQFYDLPKSLKQTENYKTYLKTKSTYPMNPKSQNLPWILLKSFKIEFIIAAIFTVVATVLAMMGPLLMKKVIYYLEKKKTIPAQFAEVLNYLMIWLGVFLLKILVGEIGDKLFFNIGLKVDSALIQDITRKIARLPATIKNHYPKAELINYVMVDVKLVGYFFKYVTYGLTSPTALLMGTFFVLSSGQPYTIIMAAILLMVASLLRLITETMSKRKRQKLRYQYERLNANTQLVEQIRELRDNGYQELIVNRTRYFRQKQNAVNFFLYFLTYLYDLVLALIPLLIIGFILFKQKFDISDKSISASQLYLILNYSTLITYPLKYMRSFYNSTQDMFFALKRLESFLFGPEIDITFPLLKQELQPGELALQNLAIVEDPLEDRHHHLFGARPKEFKPKGEVTLPLTIQISKGQTITVLSQRGEGRILLSALGSQINIRQGRVSYGGTMMYSPSKPWLYKGTISENITYSILAQSQKLTVEQVCSLCDLNGILANLPQGLETTITDLPPLSPSGIKKLQLARYLYASPDIFLLDDPFVGMQQGAGSIILNNIKQRLPQKTIILSCNDPQLLGPNDTVIVFHDNSAAAYGKVSELMKDEHSVLRMYLKENQRDVQKYSTGKKTPNHQDNNLKLMHAQSHQKHQQQQPEEHHQQHHEGKQHGASHSQQHGQQGEGHAHGHGHGHHSHYQVDGTHHQPRIPFKKYWRLFNASHSSLFKLIAILLFFAQLFKAYANWWVSHISHHHGKIKLSKQLQNLNIFIQATMLFAFIHLVEGILSAYLSKQNSNAFSEHTMKSLARADMEFFETHDLIVVALKSNKDFEDTFTITYYFQTVLRNSLLFLATYIGVTIETPEFWAIGLIVLLCGVTLYLNFSRAERDVMRYYTPTYEESQKELEQYIDGLDTIKPLGTAKVQKLRHSWDLKLHDLFVVRLNQKYLYQGLNIACQILSLIVPFLPALYAVYNKKALSEHSCHVFIAFILYSSKLCSLVSSLTKDAAYVQNLMRLSIKKNLDIIDLPAQKDHYSHSDPYWPRSSQLQIEGVSVGDDRCKRMELNAVNIAVPAGERVVIRGKEADGVAALKKVLARRGKWQDQTGQVRVAGVPIQTVGLRNYVDSVMYLTASPFVFTGTLRQNIDPFCEYPDKTILRTIVNFDFQNLLLTKSTEQSLRLGILNQRLNFEDITIAMKHSISMIRALIRQPTIVLCDNIQPNYCLVPTFEILSNKMPESTILIDNASLIDIMKANIVITFGNGNVEEYGDPEELLEKDTKFKEFVKRIPIYGKPQIKIE